MFMKILGWRYRRVWNEWLIEMTNCLIVPGKLAKSFVNFLMKLTVNRFTPQIFGHLMVLESHYESKKRQFFKESRFWRRETIFEIAITWSQRKFVEGRNFYEKLRKNLHFKYQTGNFGYNCSVKNVTLVDFLSSVELSTDTVWVFSRPDDASEETLSRLPSLARHVVFRP